MLRQMVQNQTALPRVSDIFPRPVRSLRTPLPHQASQSSPPALLLAAEVPYMSLQVDIRRAASSRAGHGTQAARVRNSPPRPRTPVSHCHQAKAIARSKRTDCYVGRTLTHQPNSPKRIQCCYTGTAPPSTPTECPRDGNKPPSPSQSCQLI